MNMSIGVRTLRWLAPLALVVCAAGPGVENPLGPLAPVGHWKGDDPVVAAPPPAPPPPAQNPPPANPPAPPPAPPDPKPAGASDASGNGRTGSYANGATVAKDLPPLKFPNTGCFSFNGVSGMVTIPDAPGLRMTSDFTLSFWKRKTAPTADWVRLVGKGGGPRNYGVWEMPAAENRLLFQIYNQNGGSVLELYTPAGIPMNTWAHVLVCLSGNAASIWINGQQVANGQKNGDAGTSAEPLTLGHAGYHGFFAGQMDDVRLYNRALSTSEILYLAQGNGGPAAPSGLQAKGAGAGPVQLAWTPTATPSPAGTFTTYCVKRSKKSGGDYEALPSGLPATLYTDNTAEAGATYFYVVTAVNTGGESAPSNEITVAVPK
jgi:hypothetical protein